MRVKVRKIWWVGAGIGLGVRLKVKHFVYNHVVVRVNVLFSTLKYKKVSGEGSKFS